MSKENRRKSLNKKETYLPRNDFTVDDSKIYIIATIIMFHIVPLIFVAASKLYDENIMVIYTSFYITTNSLFLAIAGLIYGLRKGFDAKYPLLMTVLAVLSLIFYAEFTPETAVSYRLAFAITYLIISYGAVLIGALIRKLFGLSR